ncbi:hypothetical protein Pyn_08083 [Prunus yedoensis var. nudiflora]|uniref:Uncharacterized protein n=1 Tax=Prunus yedoensis var. nudiflora TaxID=2094558 RepID=A0A314XPV7_PRUYE|nr:hypothetical protein Pyn_08083 [Prunus yedoensis var. nudiflora]
MFPRPTHTSRSSSTSITQPLDVAAARPFHGMNKPVTPGGTKVSSLPQARGQVPPGGPNPCTNIPRPGDGHCSK